MSLFSRVGGQPGEVDAVSPPRSFRSRTPGPPPFSSRKDYARFFESAPKGGRIAFARHGPLGFEIFNHYGWNTRQVGKFGSGEANQSPSGSALRGCDRSVSHCFASLPGLVHEARAETSRQAGSPPSGGYREMVVFASPSQRRWAEEYATERSIGSRG